jgi:hypothetical protein
MPLQEDPRDLVPIRINQNYALVFNSPTFVDENLTILEGSSLLLAIDSLPLGINYEIEIDSGKIDCKIANHTSKL